VFVPAVRHPPARAISKTVMPDGMVKIEIGEIVLDLTPREDRHLAALMAGSAAQLAAVVSGAESTAQIVALRMRVRRMEAELREASHASTADDSQHSPD